MEMRKMVGIIPIFLPGLFLVSVWAETKYVLQHSSSTKPLYINDSLILELTNKILEDNPRKYLHAAVSVITDENKHLLVHFISLDIAFENSEPDRLHIFEYKTNGKPRKLTPIQGLFGIYDPYYRHTSTGVKDYVSSLNKLRFDYMGRPSLLYSGFSILITAFKFPNIEGKCEIGYFKCRRKSMCIPVSVICDGQTNCGEDDLSDEKNCKVIYTTGLEGAYAITTAAVVGGLAIILFLVVIGITACLLIKLNKRNYMRRQSIHVLAKKSSNGKWAITNDMGLTNFYAPPTYEDVVRSKEDPPPAYHTLAQANLQTCSPSNNENVTVVCIETRSVRFYSDNIEDSGNITMAVSCTHVQPCACSDNETSDSQNDVTSSNSVQSDLDSAQSSSSNCKIKSDSTSMKSSASKTSLPCDKISDIIEYINSEDENDSYV